MTAEEFKSLPREDQAIQVRAALDELVKLQSHYASLLNAYDGGERIQFATSEEWILRLYKTSLLPVKPAVAR